MVVVLMVLLLKSMKMVLTVSKTKKLLWNLTLLVVLPPNSDVVKMVPLPKIMLKEPTVQVIPILVVDLCMVVVPMVKPKNGTKPEIIVQVSDVKLLISVVALMESLLNLVILEPIVQPLLMPVKVLNMVVVKMVELKNPTKLELIVQKEKMKKIVLSLNLVVVQMDVLPWKMKKDPTVQKLSMMTVCIVISVVVQMVLLP